MCRIETETPKFCFGFFVVVVAVLKLLLAQNLPNSVNTHTHKHWRYTLKRNIYFGVYLTAVS